jgi:serine/threonine-protein kinase SRPK3
LGVSSWGDRHLSEKIQPVALRAPEVLIEAPWDASTDFWNLGAVLLELFRAVRIFGGAVPPDGHYELKEHLAEIVDLFDPFPKELLDKGNQDIVGGIFDDEG